MEALTEKIRKANAAARGQAKDAKLEHYARRTLTGFYQFDAFFDMVGDDVMHPDEDGEYEPLVGYIALEQSGAAVDMLGQRLVHVKRVDLK